MYRLFKAGAVVAMITLVFGGVAPQVDAASVTDRVLGRIVLSVEEHGEAWYIDPVKRTRVYLKDGPTAYTILEDYGLGITDADLDLIPVGLDDRFALTDTDGDGLFDALETGLGTHSHSADSDGDGVGDKAEVLAWTNPMGTGDMGEDAALVRRLHGRILLQVERNGEAWYVNPADSKRYYMANGEAAYEVMRYLGLGITLGDLAQIRIEGQGSETGGATRSYEQRTVATRNGNFTAHIVELDRDAYSMKTVVREDSDCEGGCNAATLADYVNELGGVVGINGTYFCPPDYGYCASKTYSFLPPVYDTDSDTMINADTMIFHNRPMVAQTQDGDLHYFHRDDNFGATLDAFESTQGVVNGVMGSWPSLVENGSSVLSGEPQESAFNNRGLRGGIGWDDESIYLVNVSGATMDDLSAVFEALSVDFAMNLDGGGSSALIYNNEYKVGPGRLLPNAIVFVKN